MMSSEGMQWEKSELAFYQLPEKNSCYFWVTRRTWECNSVSTYQKLGTLFLILYYLLGTWLSISLSLLFSLCSWLRIHYIWRSVGVSGSPWVPLFLWVGCCPVAGYNCLQPISAKQYGYDCTHLLKRHCILWKARYVVSDSQERYW